jgi:hypothetical protein
MTAQVRKKPFLKMVARVGYHSPFLILLVISSAFFFSGIRLIPFHPDESTQLFMSSDFDRFIQAPLSMGWQPQGEQDVRQQYRELDAPLTRYILGFSRSLVGLPALQVDWDWSQSWEANRLAGALPEPKLLFTARLAITMLLPFSLTLIYSIGNSLGGRFCGLLSVVFLASNALVLMHARRAMAEGALLFGVVLTLWSFLQVEKHPWLTGLAAAIAYNAKQSAFPLALLGLALVAWFHFRGPRKVKKGILATSIYLAVFLGFTFFLNPLWWTNTASALKSSWEARRELSTRQLFEIGLLIPNEVLKTPVEKMAAWLGNLFFLPAAVADVGNYLKDTAGLQAAYFAVPGHNLFRGFLSGGVLLCINLFGVIAAVIQVKNMPAVQQKAVVILLISTGLEIAFLVWAIPLAWQRYVIPVIPFSCLFAGLGLSRLIMIPKPITSFRRIILDKK